jgi:hypothetical protein
LLPSALLQQLGFGSISTLDYDKDGWIDLIITGETTDVPRVVKTFLLRNKGGEQGFEDVTASLFSTTILPITDSAVAVTDIDGDGYDDFVMAGGTGIALDEMSTSLFMYNPRLHLFENRTDLLPNVVPIFRAELQFADINSDNRPDLLLTGAINFEFPSVQFYINNFPQVTPFLLPIATT